MEDYKIKVYCYPNYEKVQSNLLNFRMIMDK